MGSAPECEFMSSLVSVVVPTTTGAELRRPELGRGTNLTPLFGTNFSVSFEQQVSQSQKKTVDDVGFTLQIAFGTSRHGSDGRLTSKR